MPRAVLASSLAATLLLAALAAGGAAAESPRERLELRLSHYERLPSREQLLALSPQVERLLQELVLKPSRHVLARSRAIALLRLFPGPATARVLRETIHSSARGKGGVAWLDLQQALSSYALVAGPASLQVIEPFLAHLSPDVRHAAVGAVALVRSPRVLVLLEQRRRVEPSPMVRHRLDRELARLAGRRD